VRKVLLVRSITSFVASYVLFLLQTVMYVTFDGILNQGFISCAKVTWIAFSPDLLTQPRKTADFGLYAASRRNQEDRNEELLLSAEQQGLA